MPSPFSRRIRIFPRQRIGQEHFAETVFDILLVLRLHFLQVPLQSRCHVHRQHRHSILPSLPVAHRHPRVTKIDIFYRVRYLLSLVFR